MFAWLIWWHALPVPIRRLIGAVLICGIAAGGVALAVHRYGNRREQAGWNAGYNHAVVIETRKQVIVVDSLERRADSIAAQAARINTLRVSVIPPSPHPRIAPLSAADSLVPTVPLSQLVRIYVANDDTPHYADRYVGNLVAWYDSTVYRVLLPQRDSAVVLALAWKRAWGAEHDARIGADSLSALWRTRALNIVAPPKQSHAKRDMVFTALGVVAGAVLHNQFRHR